MKNRKVVQKELKVMFSKDTQPVWFRITKWSVFISVGYLLYETKWFWVWVIGIATAGTIMHIIYRWRTKVWTKSWGRWEKR